jgi:hypothetical protein
MTVYVVEIGNWHKIGSTILGVFISFEGAIGAVREFDSTRKPTMTGGPWSTLAYPNADSEPKELKNQGPIAASRVWTIQTPADHYTITEHTVR